MKSIISLFIIAGFLLTGACVKSDNSITPPLLSVKDTAILFAIAGGTSTTNVTQYVTDTTSSWIIANTGQDTSMPAWLTVTPRTGKGSNAAQINITAADNTLAPGAARNAVLTVKSNNAAMPAVTFKISQAYDTAYDITSKITDTAFRRVCVTAYGDGYSIKNTQASRATNLNASGRAVASLAGINYFTGLQSLDCSNCIANNGAFLTSISLTGNTKLTSLNCSNDAKVTSIDISKCLLLTTLNSAGCTTLTTIYVWPGFTPPAGFTKPASANYVVKP